jgi:hypothetical protein
VEAGQHDEAKEIRVPLDWAHAFDLWRLRDWQRRPCFLCGGFGYCEHREWRVEIAMFRVWAARVRRQGRSPLAELRSPWVGCVAPGLVIGRR